MRKLILILILLTPTICSAATLSITVPDQAAADLADAWANTEGLSLANAAQKKTYLENKLKAYLKAEYIDRLELPTRETSARDAAISATNTAFGG